MKIDLELLWSKLSPDTQAVVSTLDYSQMTELCEAVASSCTGGHTPPYIENGTLHIPFGSPRKYWWWHPEGQSLEDTLNELNADEETLRKYIPTRIGV